MEEAYYAEYELVERGHWWFSGRRRILRSVIESAWGWRGGGRLLETGTATGAMAEMLSRYGWFVGLDPSEQALRAARLKVGRLVAGRVETLPFPPATFDAVFACDVIEHVDDDRQALLEIRRVAKPTARLFLTVPAFEFLWSAHDEINHHRRRYRRRDLARAFAATGWQIEKLTYFNTLLFPPVAGVRLLEKTLRRRARHGRSDFDRPLSAVANTILEAVFASERHLLRRFDLPFGVSLLAVATPAGRSQADP